MSALEAKLKAEGECDKFRVRQDREYISDFDRDVKRLQGGPRSQPKPEGGDDE